MPRYTACTYFWYVCIQAFLMYYWLSWEGIIVLSFLMFFDTIFGVWKVYVMEWHKWWHWFSSRRLRIWIICKVSIITSIILFALAFSNMVELLWSDVDKAQITSFVIWPITWLLIGGELVSVIQNVLIIRKREYIPERDAVTEILSWVLNTLKKAVQERTKDIP